jgi:hypothetical protein
MHGAHIEHILSSSVIVVVDCEEEQHERDTLSLHNTLTNPATDQTRGHCVTRDYQHQYPPHLESTSTHYPTLVQHSTSQLTNSHPVGNREMNNGDIRHHPCKSIVRSCLSPNIALTISQTEGFVSLYCGIIEMHCQSQYSMELGVHFWLFINLAFWNMKPGGCVGNSYTLRAYTYMFPDFMFLVNTAIDNLGVDATLRTSSYRYNHLCTPYITH